MTPRIFIVDVRVLAPEPGLGVVTEFGIVDVAELNWVHGHIGEDVWLDVRWARDASENPIGRESVIDRTLPGGDPGLAIFWMLNQWINAVVGRSPAIQPPLPVFVAARDSDLTWFADGFRRAGLPPQFERGDRASLTAQDAPDVHSALGFILDQKHGATT